MKTEADSNDISAKCLRDDDKWPTVGMFGLSDAVFSAVIRLSVCYTLQSQKRSALSPVYHV